MKHPAAWRSRFGINRSRWQAFVRPFVERLEDRLPPGNLFGEFWSTPVLPVAISEPATTVLVQREDERQPVQAAKESAAPQEPTANRGQTARLVWRNDGASPEAIARTVTAGVIRGTPEAGGLFTDPLTGEQDHAAELLVYPALTPDFDASRGFPDAGGSVSVAPDSRAGNPAIGSVAVSDTRAGGSHETDVLVQALAVQQVLNPAPQAGSLADRFAAAALPVGSAAGSAVAQGTVGLSASDFVAGALLFQLQPGTEADLDTLLPARLSSRVTVGKTAVPGLFEVRGSGDDLAQLAADFARQPFVSYVEPVQYARPALAPNDPSYTDGTLFNLNGTYGIRAPQAWDQLTNTISVPVAVIDSGADYLHPDLYNNIWINQAEIPSARLANLTDTDSDGVITFWDLNFTPNGTTFPNRGVGKITDSNGNGFIDAADLLAPFNLNGTGGWANGVSDDGDTYVDDLVGWNFVSNNNNPLDDNGHGTHVTGTLGAVGNNNTGIVGISWRSRIMPLKFFDASGSGTSTGAVNAIRYAADHGARVSNNSWIVGSSNAAAVYNAIDYARTQGMVFVVAAGNQAQNIDTSPIFPAAFTLENIIAVAATTSDGSLSSISNYGAVSVDLAAPGESIYSTEIGDYGYRTGTSFATPHVAGAVALVMAQNPSFTMAQAISRVLNTTTPLESVASITVTGGLLNAERALSPTTNLSWSGTLTGPASTTTQGTFTINRTYTVALNAVVNNFTISYYASTDTTFGNADDLLIGSETITAAAGKTVGNHAGTSPSLRIGRPGAQRILAVVDARDNVAETNEANNLAVSSTVTTVSGLADVLVDNNQPGYSETGLGWNHASGSSAGFNTNSRQHSAGTGTSTASWQVTALPAGNYDVQVTWTAATNRATNAQVTVFDGTTLVRTVQINQQVAPVGTTVQGSVFQSLGPLNLTSGLLRVTLSDNANGVVVADAVRFLGVPASSSVQVLDDGDTPGFTATSGFFSFTGQGYQNDVTYAAAGTGSDTATWTFTGLLPGLYRVSTTWSEHPNRATNAPFTVYDGTTAGTNLGTVLVNQELAPNHFTANGASWRNLGGPFSINSDTLTVRLTNNANEYVIADAVRIERLTTNPVTILDDGETPGFNATSGFFSFTGQGYQNDVTYAEAGTGTHTATWTFSGLTAGTYRVSATWSIHANRATNAPFSVYNGTPLPANLLGTTLVNQEQAPGDFTSSGAGWRDLRTTGGSDVFTLTGPTLTVRLTDNANEYVIADAIRIERLF